MLSERTGRLDGALGRARGAVRGRGGRTADDPIKATPIDLDPFGRRTGNGRIGADLAIRFGGI
jgi:hypothetical protein